MLPLASAAAEETELTGIAAWSVSLMETLGAPGAGAALAIETVFPPIPSELVLPLAGFTASRGSFTLAESIAWTTAGSVFGALVLYLLGAWLGRERFRAIWDRLPLVTLTDLDKAEAWFSRHGKKAVFFGRCIPMVRSLISLPAGVERMNMGVFLLLTLAGSLIWNSIFVVAGYQLGEQWFRIEPYAGILQRVVIVLGVLAVGGWIAHRIWQRRRAAGA